MSNTQPTNQFNEEQVRAAKQMRDRIIEENIGELKSIYMAGEICMWYELRNKALSNPSTVEAGQEEGKGMVKEILELIELRLEDSDPEYAMGLELIRREIHNLLAKSATTPISEGKGELYSREQIESVALGAARYGFTYRDISQHSGFVPEGNTLQWLQNFITQMKTGKDFIKDNNFDHLL